MITAKQFDKAFAEILAETENDKRDIVLDFLAGMQNFIDGNLDAEIDGATEEALYLVALMNEHLDTIVFKRVVSAMERAHAVLMKLEVVRIPYSKPPCEGIEERSCRAGERPATPRLCIGPLPLQSK